MTALSPLSARSEATTRRTYNRPLDDAGSKFETWEETVHRSHYLHHMKLWRDAGGIPNLAELNELVALGLDRSGLVSGRTLWLGGTEYGFSRASSNFNCSALNLETVFDLVDAMWLLLNGCGVGGKAKAGTLHGYYRHIPEVKVIPSENDKDFRGRKENVETLPSADNGWTWTISVGDSAEAWAKAPGKMLVSPRSRVDRLVLDFSQIRGKGGRLKGYGWICNGYKPFADALTAVHNILNRNAGNLLNEEDILDIFNWFGTVLSSRRAAEAGLMDDHHPLVGQFATRKKDYWLTGNTQRRQSNNSILFWRRPSVDDIADLLLMNLDGGEPGFVNAAAALRKCSWFNGFNPCFEIALPSHGFCNLVSLCLPSFGQDFGKLERAVWVMARANYRQTCVNLEDGVLQRRWHQTNESLRLCGVSFTGIVQASHLTDYQIRRLRNAAVCGAYSMADELGLPRPKAVTTIKPEGCRPPESLVTTDRGIFTLAELFTGHPDGDVWADQKDGLIATFPDDGGRPLTRTFDNGVKEVFEVRLSYGLSVRSTANHPWFVKEHYDHSRGEKHKHSPVNRYVRTDELKEGDVLDVRPGVYGSTTPAKLDAMVPASIRFQTGQSPITMPSEMNADIAWLLGYLWGDGCMMPQKWRLRFIDGGTSRLEKVQRILKQQFNLDASIKTATGKRAYTLEVGSAQLWHWLVRNGVWKYAADGIDHIPQCVRTSAKEHVIAFLAGLCDADGCVSVSNDYKAVVISTADAAFARHIQDVAWAVGLAFGRSLNSLGKNFQRKQKEMYLLNMSSASVAADVDSFRRHSVKCRLADESSDLEWFHHCTKAKHIVGRVKAVVSVGEMPTCDVEVDETNRFFAGAVHSHNTRSKISGRIGQEIGEGMHNPLGRYVFNWINFSVDDPLVGALESAGYKTLPSPSDPNNILVRFPVDYAGCKFATVGGKQVNTETAIDQLERYKRWNTLWADHNVSSTISMDRAEVPATAKWIYDNWDENYIATAFLQRADPTKTAKDLGHPYLPQEVVTEDDFRTATDILRPVDWDRFHTGWYEISDTSGCEATGTCPTK